MAGSTNRWRFSSRPGFRGCTRASRGAIRSCGRSAPSAAPPVPEYRPAPRNPGRTGDAANRTDLQANLGRGQLESGAQQRCVERAIAKAAGDSDEGGGHGAHPWQRPPPSCGVGRAFPAQARVLARKCMVYVSAVVRFAAPQEVKRPHDTRWIGNVTGRPVTGKTRPTARAIASVPAHRPPSFRCTDAIHQGGNHAERAPSVVGVPRASGALRSGGRPGAGAVRAARHIRQSWCVLGG